LKLKINAHNVTITDALRDYAEAKVRKLDRHFDRIHEARLEIEAAAKRASDPIRALILHVHVNGSVLEGRVQSRDLMAGVDQVVDKLDEQLRRRKERLTEHRGVPARGAPEI
jgi:putative sigma-54 modulation protein